MRLLMIIITLVIILIAGCTTNATDTQEEIDDCTDSATCNAVLNTDKIKDTEFERNIDKLEIYHFHATQQCYSCITLGDYAEATVNTYFKDELESGLIVFDHINVDSALYKDIVDKYGASGSSLWLGTYKGEDFKAEENTNVWYKIRDKEAFMDYLKGVIEQKLAGELS